MAPPIRNIIAWARQVALALLFIKSGFGKLSHPDGTLSMLGSMGLPDWFGGGLGLLMPRTVRPAALSLLIIVAGAVMLHAAVLPGGMAKGGPALVFLLLLVVLPRLRRPTPRVA